MNSDFQTEYWPINPISLANSNVRKVKYLSAEFKSNMSEFSAGALGGCAGLIVGHPLDTVKTVTQNSTKKMAISEGFNGVGQHGYKTFYRGLSLPFWSYAVSNACLFASYKLAQRTIDPDETSTNASALCGAFAGCVQLIPATPVEVIKIHMQSDAIHMGKITTQGPMKYIRRIIANEGILGLYKGVTIQALRDIPAFIIYFYTYKFSNNFFIDSKIIDNSMARTFISGALAGALSWVLLIPQDVMKTRIQGGIDKNITESFKALQKIGTESFFRGGTMLTIRALLVNAITFMVYEKCSAAFTSD